MKFVKKPQSAFIKFNADTYKLYPFHVAIQELKKKKKHVLMKCDFLKQHMGIILTILLNFKNKIRA